jgi:hypothetical protein
MPTQASCMLYAAHDVCQPGCKLNQASLGNMPCAVAPHASHSVMVFCTAIHNNVCHMGD